MARCAHDAQQRSFDIPLLALLIAVAAVAVSASESEYTVSRGDTLYSIARRHQLSVDELLSANRLEPQAVLKVGQRLVLPGAAAAVVPTALGSDHPAPRCPSYQVQPGDNLYRIAERLGLSVDELAEANELTARSILQIGQTLRVPGADLPAARAATAVAKPAAAAAKPTTAEPDRVWVAESRVHLRAGASTQQRSVGLFTAGTALKVLGKDGMWWRVCHPETGGQAFVAGWVVSESPVEAAAPPVAEPREGGGYGYALEPRTNVRAEPTSDSERVAVAVRGTKMAILGSAEGWFKVKFDNGTTGWVARHLVRTTPDAPSGGGHGSDLVATAMGYLGSPYRRGGTSRGGVDCSGLVYAVCRAHGIKLPRTSRGMWGVGQPVGKGNLRPGDLVFFKNTYRSGISHVGIYVGNNRFVHAVRPGAGVRVTSLSEPYYAHSWAGAYRVTD